MCRMNCAFGVRKFAKDRVSHDMANNIGFPCFSGRYARERLPTDIYEKDKDTRQSF